MNQHQWTQDYAAKVERALQRARGVPVAEPAPETPKKPSPSGNRKRGAPLRYPPYQVGEVVSGRTVVQVGNRNARGDELVTVECPACHRRVTAAAHRLRYKARTGKARCRCQWRPACSVCGDAKHRRQKHQ